MTSLRTQKSVLGLDIGGANLKLAHTDGTAHTLPFELWKQPKRLPAALRELIALAPAFDEIAVTMTGELCDCFATRREGVQFILDSLPIDACHKLRIWRNDGQFVALSTARQTPLQVASANWLALATFVCRFAATGPALLIDIGSTTTDIIPILYGEPIPQGRTDAERLVSSELVYRGVRRTPIAWSLRSGLAAELFATVHDAFVLLGKTPESAEDCGTADGRPAIIRNAHARLARMLGADGETCPEAATQELALMNIARLREEIAQAISLVARRLPSPPRTAIIAGSGEFLAREIIDTPGCVLISLNERLGPKLSSAACAYAIAVLAAEQNDEQCARR